MKVGRVLQYAHDIDDGAIPACKWVRLACRRFLDDLEHGHERGLAFDEQKVEEVFGFYELVPHIKGEWAGQPIRLSDWQGFVVANLFGWVWVETGKRRFKSAYIEVARKNGKSTFVAPLGLYMLKDDDEPGAEIYSAATSRDQARIVFDTARDMVRQSSLRYHLQAYNHSVCHEASCSAFKPLASDSDTLEGKNTHLGLIDELHAHKNRRVYDVLELSCAARSQPLLLVITTAGEDRTGICYEVRSHITKILDGVYEDDTSFGIIYTLDDPDEWTNEELWVQANPNLGVSVKLDDMRRLCQKAQQTPAAASEFKRKRLDIWGAGESAYFNMEAWRQCPALEEGQLQGLPCYLGLDLASKRDIAALVALFADSDRRYHLKGWFFLPEAVLDPHATGKSHHIQTLYQTWAEQGWLILTPGQIIDYQKIRQTTVQVAQRYDAKEVAFDPWGATQLATQLAEEDGLTLVEVHQSVKNFSEAMKETEAVTTDLRISHEHSPLMAWMMSNVEARVDRNDNVFPNKASADNKIDGPVAGFLAMNRALVHQDTDSVYDQEDLLVL